MTSPFLSEVKIVSFNYAPKGWALCNGQLLPINQNQALFSLLGTTYGGNGQTNFALPNLQGRIPMHVGDGHVLGELGGTPTVTLSGPQLAIHNHAMFAFALDARTGATGRNPGTTARTAWPAGHAAKGGGGTTRVTLNRTRGASTA